MIALMIAALWSSVAQATDSPRESQPPTECQTTAALFSALKAGADLAHGGNVQGAKAAIESFKADCGAEPARIALETWVSLASLHAKHYENVLVRTNTLPRPAPFPIGALTSWLAMLAARSEGDVSGFNKERDALLEAVDQTLGASTGPYHGHRIEAFETAGAKVTAYDADVPQGNFDRKMEFIIVPAGRMALPEAVMLTDDHLVDGQFSSAKAPRTYFIDFYDCNHQALLSGAAAGPVDYSAFKSLVVSYLGRNTSPASVDPGTDCHFYNYVTPGLSR